MALTTRRCNQCGGVIQVDNSREKGICPFCETEYYFPKGTYNDEGIRNKIDAQGTNVENYLELITKFYNQNNYDEATKYLSQALPLEPNNAKLWLLKLKILCALIKSTDSVTEDDFIGTLNEIIGLTIENDYEILLETLEILYGFHIYCAEKYEKIGEDKQKDKQVINTIRNRLSALNMFLIYFLIHSIILDERCPDIIIDAFLKMDMENANKQGYTLCPYKLLNTGISIFTFRDSSILKVPELKVKNKKGEEKDPIYFGTYLLYWIKKKHPDYASTTLEAAEKLMHDTDTGGCYIATCVYGSYNCPPVWTLRRFRDYTLAVHWYGRMFIKVYYTLSPTLVKWFGKTNWFKVLCKKSLDRFVAELQKNGVEDTYYTDELL